LGYAGRGGSSEFYISSVNNTSAHGPGTDRGGKDPEADSLFGRIIPNTHGEEIVEFMRKQPGKSNSNGFIQEGEHHIHILSMKLLVRTPSSPETCNFSANSLFLPNVDKHTQVIDTHNSTTSIHAGNLPQYCEQYL
jgi:hypothetical protein